MFKKLRGLKNELEAKFIKKDQNQEDKELDDLLQKRKRMIALIMY